MTDHRIVEDDDSSSERSSKVRKAQRGDVRGIDLARLDGEDSNPFWFDESKIPPGMAYGWKRVTFAGQEDIRHQSRVSRRGFTPVPKSRHPEIIGAADAERDPNGCIVLDGQMLMERPEELEEQAKELLRNEARSRVNNHVQSLGLAKPGAPPRKVTKLRKTYERPDRLPEDDEE